MRKVALSLLFVCTLVCRAQMWDGLACTPYRLDTTQVHCLNVDVDALAFFRDNEFTSRLTDGYSLPGLWLQPKLSFMPVSQIKLELGLHALIFNGANRYPNYVYHDIGQWKGDQYTGGMHVLPWFRAQAEFKHLSIVLGNIYGGQNHGLIEPLFNPETNLSQDPEMGVQLLWDRPHLHMDTWLNWQSYIFKEETHQEAFTVGSGWRVLFNEPSATIHCYLPISVVIQHRGGEQDNTDTGVQTISNGAAGFGVKWNTGRKVLRALQGEANVLGAYQQAGMLWPFTTGMAMHAAADANLWDKLEVGLGYFHAPKSFVSLYGNHFYTTQSVRDHLDYGRLHTLSSHVRFHHDFAPGYTLGADVEAYQTWQGGEQEFNFSFGVYFRTSPSFLLKSFAK